MAAAIHSQLRAASGSAIQAVLFGSLLPPSPWTAPIQIQQRIRAAFEAAPALAGGNIRTNRHLPLGPREAQGLRIYLINSAPPRRAYASGPQDWVSTWRVDCLARAADAKADTDPTEAADPLLRAAWSRAARLLTPAALSDLAVHDVTVATRIAWDSEEADTPVANPYFYIQVEHRCAADDLRPA